MVEHQPLVVDAQPMQHRGVEVVPMHAVLDGMESELVGRPVGQAVPQPRAG